MTVIVSKSWPLLMLICLHLSGCATTTVEHEDRDATGALGTNQADSPATVYVEMGVAYLRDGQTATALKKLKKALNVDPGNASAHNVIAIIYERLGEADEAMDHYDTAVRLDPKDPYIRNARGSYNCKQGRFQQADMDFKSALSNPLYPTPWVAQTNAGICADRFGDDDLAENYFRQALTSNPKFTPALMRMAQLSYDQENYLSARAYLERYNQASQITAASLWLGIQVERRLGDRNKAAEYRQLLIEQFPDAVEVQLLNQSEQR